MKQFNNLTIQQSVLDALRYFSFFDYPPTLEEIYTFIKKKAQKRRIMSILEKMVKEKVIAIRIMGKGKDAGLEKGFGLGLKNDNPTSLPLNKTGFLTLIQYPSFYHSPSRYTLTQYNKISESVKQWNNRHKISLKKIQKILPYVQLLSLFPSIKLIGLSGSVAMLNADEDHDVDLFIITAKNRLWTGRFLALVLAQLLGIRRSRHSGKRPSDNEGERPESKQRFWSTHFVRPQNDERKHKNKVCLNLLFDEFNLKIPKFKQTEYVAHEVLQMKPLIDKSETYMRFIDANRWVFDIFPNSRSGSTLISTQINAASVNPRNHLRKSASTVSNFIEYLLKSLQLHFINCHRTTEIITESQLWFHPDDFEKKLV